MKLDHLMTRAQSLSVERSVDCDEKVKAVIHDDSLPAVHVEYTTDRINTSLKMKMLVDDGLPDSAEGRTLEIRLYSSESLEALFNLVDLIREMVKGTRRVTATSIPTIPF